MGRNLIAWSRSLRFLQLAVFILLFFLIMPFVAGHPFISLFFQLILLNALLVSLSASDRLPRLRWVLLALWLAAVVIFLKAKLVSGAGPQHLDLVLGSASYLLFLLGCIAAILTYVFRSPRVTLDTIFAAVVAYFFLTIIFATIYSLLFSFDPNTFNLAIAQIPDQSRLLMTEMIYFSLSTIVGVGFGDILPLLPFPRMLAAVEAVVGHFYIAVLISWLVGMFISQALRSYPESPPPDSLSPPGD